MSGFVYAIGDETGRVKIGWSSDPLRRLTKIRSDCSFPVSLLGVVSATRAQEGEVHALLKPWRINREWFRCEGPVRAFISMLRKPRPEVVEPEIGAHPLRLWRFKVGLSLEQLANLLGTTKVIIWRWETGERKIGYASLPEVVRKTGISAAQLRPDLAELLRAAE